MRLTTKECKLLIAETKRVIESGFSIGEEYYKDIDNIKRKLYEELYNI